MFVDINCYNKIKFLLEFQREDIPHHELIFLNIFRWVFFIKTINFIRWEKFLQVFFKSRPNIKNSKSFPPGAEFIDYFRYEFIPLVLIERQ